MFESFLFNFGKGLLATFTMHYTIQIRMIDRCFIKVRNKSCRDEKKNFHGTLFNLSKLEIDAIYRFPEREILAYIDKQASHEEIFSSLGQRNNGKATGLVGLLKDVRNISTSDS